MRTVPAASAVPVSEWRRTARREHVRSDGALLEWEHPRGWVISVPGVRTRTFTGYRGSARDAMAHVGRRYPATSVEV